jgi:MAM domain, meprin/A5/mu
MKLSEAVMLTATEHIGIVLSEPVRKLTTCHRHSVTLKVRFSLSVHFSFLFFYLKKKKLFSFSAETICGWIHDVDHDFDFERRSGYNNKTISILTGPSADHTVKKPFQGHYMVINTNTEVYVKKARLISPLFRLNAEKLCFEFYYHMYGISVGALRVFQKPESMELQELLNAEDAEQFFDSKNDNVIFEVKGCRSHNSRLYFISRFFFW